ncbi:MAG: WG repeat-containing protein [Bacteroidota bacterium]
MNNPFFLKPLLAAITLLGSYNLATAQYVSSYNNSFTGPNLNRAKEEAYNRQMRDDQEKWRQQRYAEDRKTNRYPSYVPVSTEAKTKTPVSTKVTPKAVVVKTSKYDYVSTYIDGLAEASLKGKSGFVDKNENEIVPVIYDEVHLFYEGLAAVKLNGKYGYVDTKGKVVIPLKYDMAWAFEKGKANVVLNNKQSFINSFGMEFLPFKYESLYACNDGFIMAWLNKKMGFIDITGKEIIPVKYDSVTFLMDGSKKMFVGGLHYYFDKSGKPMKNVYDYVMDTDEYDEDFVLLNNKWGKADKNGKIVIPLKYDMMRLTENGMTGVYRDGKWGFVNRAGKEIIPPKFDSIVSDFNKKGMAVISNSGKMFSIDKTGKITKALNGLPWGKDQDLPWRTSKFAEFFDGVDDFNHGLARVNKNNKAGFINNKGEIVIPLEYDEIFIFSEGKAIAKKNKKWGFINEKNETVIPFEYDGLHQFLGGKAPVKLGDKWGYINTAGKVIVPIEYQTVAYRFREGLSLVEKGGKWGYIDTTGVVVVPIKYNSGEDFSNGLACVSTYYNGDFRKGFINAADQMVIEPQFEFLVKFNKQGKAVVMKKDVPYIIDKTGKIVKKLTMKEYYDTVINKEDD